MAEKEKKAKATTAKATKAKATKKVAKATKAEVASVDTNRTVKSTAKTVRIAARKVRIVLDLIRGKNVDEALAILTFTPNAASEPTLKVLKSAIANAKHNHQLNEEKLFVCECYANEGVTMKRFRPRAKGSAGAIMKRTSHITVVVKER